MDGWTDGWMDGRIDGRTDGLNISWKISQKTLKNLYISLFEFFKKPEPNRHSQKLGFSDNKQLKSNILRANESVSLSCTDVNNHQPLVSCVPRTAPQVSATISFCNTVR